MKIKTTRPIRFSLNILFASILFLAAGAAMAQSEQAEQVDKDAYSVVSNNCPSAQTFTYGAGNQKFAFCITDHGNIQNLESPANYKQITTREGYVLCHGGFNSNPSYDAGLAEDGFGQPTATQPGGPHTLPLTIKRTTSDGKLELTQTFNWNKTAREILITMVVKNLSASAITKVGLARYFDGDIGGDAADDVFNSSSDSIWGVDDDSDSFQHLYALTLTTLSTNFTHYTYVEASSSWYPFGFYPSAKICYPSGFINGENQGDYVGRVLTDLTTINAGASKTATFVYRRV